MFNVFDIQRFSYHDGPGVRTTVFLKGCNLKCFWCQNPESQSKKTQLLYFKNNCIHCATCISSCKNSALLIGRDGHIAINRKKCILCGKCTEQCPTNSLKLSGRKMSAQQILAEVIEDMEMYRISGGGVTFSGGEPLLYSELPELLKMAKEQGLDTAIETAGCVDTEILCRAAKFADHIMYDIKSLDADKHKEACGGSVQLITSNLETLSKIHKDILVRIPVIPSFNDTKQDIEQITRFVKGLGLKAPQLLRFNKLGLAKYNALSRSYKAETLELLEDEHFDDLVNTVVEIFS